MTVDTNILRRLKPRHMHVLYLHWKGFTNKEIADITNFSEGHVSNIITGPNAGEVLDALRAGVYDSMRSVDQELQMVAPALITEKINLALGSADEKVRSTNCMELLQMAGHTPVRRIQRIDAHSEGHEEFGALTEDEIKADLLQKAASAGPSVPRDPDKGPDGNPLN